MVGVNAPQEGGPKAVVMGKKFSLGCTRKAGSRHPTGSGTLHCAPLTSAACTMQDKVKCLEPLFLFFLSPANLPKSSDCIIVIIMNSFFILQPV